MIDINHLTLFTGCKRIDGGWEVGWFGPIGYVRLQEDAAYGGRKHIASVKCGAMGHRVGGGCDKVLCIFLFCQDKIQDAVVGVNNGNLADPGDEYSAVASHPGIHHQQCNTSGGKVRERIPEDEAGGPDILRRDGMIDIDEGKTRNFL